MKQSIVLIGPMGAGKTTLGKKLSKQLGEPFFDTDKLVSSKYGSIERIFETKGEQFFRQKETEALREALTEPAIVATGGGLPVAEENQLLLEGAFVVFLDTTQEYVIGKINLSKRPLLKANPDRWQEIYDERVETYKKLADATVFTGGRSLTGLLAELKEVTRDVL